MEEAAHSTSFHADASVCGEALVATLAQLQESGAMSAAEAEAALRDFSLLFGGVMRGHLQSERTVTLDVDVSKGVKGRGRYQQLILP
jgi:proline racemase